MQPKDFEGTTPEFDLFEYFGGQTKAWGIFQGRNGDLKRQFVVDIRGDIEGDLLTLTEDFVYADGEVSQRIWRITRLGDNRYEGRADDVVGVAQGIASGQALNWQYTLRLPYKDSTIDVRLNDWMFLQPDGVLVNRATVSKLGFKVGEVTIFFTQIGDQG
jgi:hypothetical protein